MAGQPESQTEQRLQREAGKKHITLWLAGDVMTGRGIDQAMAYPCSPELYEGWVRDAREYVKLAEQANGRIPLPVPPEHIWGEALAEIDKHQPDLRLVNLETAVTTHGHPWPAKGIHYRMSPRHVAALQAAHIDVCSLANNHVLDWGADGLLETLRALQGAGMQTVGAGKNQASAQAPAVWPAPNGGRWLTFAWATTDSGVPRPWQATAQQAGIQTLHNLDEYSAVQLAQTVAQYRQSGDRVIVSLHWGGNWGWDVPVEQQQFAHRLIDWGVADVVHGHSSHHPRPIEVYRGKLILYGCGDLINDYEGIGRHEKGDLGVACHYLAQLSASTGELLNLTIQPWQLKRFQLVRAQKPLKQAFLGLFNEKCEPYKTRLEVQPDGSWMLRWAGGLPFTD